MSETPNESILCPVCRARQSVRHQCRRCAADLTLYCEALAAVSRAKAQWAEARQRGDQPAARAHWDYLRWLSPRDAARLQRDAEESP